MTSNADDSRRTFMTSNGNSGTEGDSEQLTNDETRGITSDDDPALGADKSWTQAAQSHFDPEEDRDLTTVIVSAIAAAKGIDPTELGSPLLYDVVDAPAIQQSFFGPGGNARTATGSTAFRYEQYLVKVRSDGWIQVYE